MKLFDLIRRKMSNYINRAIVDSKSKIGYGTYIGKYTIVEDSEIGKYSSIGPSVIIGLHNHNYHQVTTHPFVNRQSYGFIDRDYYPKNADDIATQRPVIGNDVWIGCNSVVLRGVKIGDGAVIGAGSIVTKDIPPYAIAVGNPCKVLKYRFSSEIIETLERVCWWNWSK